MLRGLCLNCYYFLTKLLIIVEGVLGIRLILQLLNANQETPIVRLLYGISGIIIAPFRNIFSPLNLSGIGIGLTIESTTLAAMAGYFLFFILISNLLKLIIKR